MRTSIPNPTVPLVDAAGRPSRALLEMIPVLSANDVVADMEGRPTPLFLTRLQAAGQSLSNARVPIVNPVAGTPTRVLTALLMSIAMEAT